MENRAEKSHPNVHGGDTEAGSAAESKRLAIVHADQHSVGKLTANDTRRVKLGAKCQ
jgi:alcohol dehydrogenase class IV